MKFDSDFNKLLSLLTGVEETERSESHRAHDACQLPVDMIPSREAFEAVGFRFEAIDGDDVLCQATLPKGWKIVPQEGSSYWSTIVDNLGKKRGSVFYKGVFYDRRGHMTLN